MTGTEAGWYRDPSGRYSLRYHDGTNWTNYVTDPAGSVMQDTTPVAPPQQPAYATAERPSYLAADEQQQQQPAQQSWGAEPSYGAPSNVRDFAGLRLAGTLVALLGFAAALLCLVLDVEWFVPSAGGSGVSIADTRDQGLDVGLDVYEPFANWGWIVVAALAALAVLGAWVRGPLRWIGMAGVIAGLIATAAAVGDFLDFYDDAEVGAAGVIAAVGLVLGIVGTALSRKPQI